MMDMQAADSLVEFCVAQRNAFAAQDWMARRDLDGKALAFAAKYLSMTSWYGHEEELEQIAARMHSFADSSLGLHQESRVIDFDLPSFSVKMRRGIAQSRAAVQFEAPGEPEVACAMTIPAFLLKHVAPPAA